MKTSLISGLNKQDAEEIVLAFKGSARLRERYITILTEKLESNRKMLRSKDMYDKPSWQYLQADGIGYERAVFELISLLSSKTE